MYLPSTENWAVRGQLRRSQLHVSEKAMAPHSSTLAWKIPWMEEPGGLQSLGSGESDTTSLSLFIFMNWRRNWLPTPVFLPGESQGQGSLLGCCLWGRTESDTTEVTQQQQPQVHVWYLSWDGWMKLLEFNWSFLPNKIQLLTWGSAFQTAKVKAIMSIIRLPQTDIGSLCHILWVKTSHMETYIKERGY